MLVFEITIALPVEAAEPFEQLHYEHVTSKRKSYAGSIRVEMGQFSQDSEKDGLISLDGVYDVPRCGCNTSVCTDTIMLPVVAASNLPTPRGNSNGDCNPFVVVGYK